MSFVIGGGGNGVAGAGVRPTSSWRHVAATYDGKDASIYVDGEVAATRSLNVPIHRGGGPFYLRYPLLYGSDTELPFAGALDDVRVYRRALSAEELRQLYRQDRDWRQGRMVATGKMVVGAHAYAAVPRLRVEVDFVGLQPLPAGAAIVVGLLDPAGGTTVDRQETTELPASDRFVTRFDTAKLPPGQYQVRCSARAGAGTPIGAASDVPVTLPPPRSGPPATAAGAKRLNNLVTELLRVQAPEPGGLRQYRFMNPRDGWVFVAADAVVEDGGEVWIALDSAAAQDAVIVHRQGPPRILETMRWLLAGEHTLEVHAEGGTASHLVVRAMPEISFAENGYPWSPFLPGMGPHSPEFLEQIGVFRNCNVVLERHAVGPFAARWRARDQHRHPRRGTTAVRVLHQPFRERHLWPCRQGLHPRQQPADHVPLPRLSPPHRHGAVDPFRLGRRRRAGRAGRAGADAQFHRGPAVPGRLSGRAPQRTGHGTAGKGPRCGADP
jgi:hypothetical protein